MRWAGDHSRSYAVFAPAVQDASQLYYSFLGGTPRLLVPKWGGMGGGGGGGGGG